MDVNDPHLNDPAPNDTVLRPREVVPTAARGRKKPWFAYGVLALALVAGGVFVAKFLTNALDYYCNVDEVGVKDGCDVGRSIRIRRGGEKVAVAGAGSVASFVVPFNGGSMPVDLSSDPTGLFQECIPVVVTGRVVENTDGSRVFEGEEVLVKHDENYDKENEARVDKANAEADACSART